MPTWAPILESVGTDYVFVSLVFCPASHRQPHDNHRKVSLRAARAPHESLNVKGARGKNTTKNTAFKDFRNDLVKGKCLTFLVQATSSEADILARGLDSPPCILSLRRVAHPQLPSSQMLNLQKQP